MLAPIRALRTVSARWWTPWRITAERLSPIPCREGFPAEVWTVCSGSVWKGEVLQVIDDDETTVLADLGGVTSAGSVAAVLEGRRASLASALTARPRGPVVAVVDVLQSPTGREYVLSVLVTGDDPVLIDSLGLFPHDRSIPATARVEVIEGEETNTVGEYFSCRSGPEPELSGHDSLKGQLDALVERIKTWEADGVELEAIGIAARTKASLDAAESALRNGGITLCRLPADDLPNQPGVRLGTMHRMKGLEFLRVAIIDADDQTIPLSFALSDPTEDRAQHVNDLIRERCILYVAATRARDGLWVGWSGPPSRFIEPALG